MAAPQFYDAFLRDLPGMSGKVVVVTGCTSGVGLVFAKACAQKGATVVLLNRDSQRAVAAAEAVRETGARVVHVACDLMDFQSVRVAVEELRETFGECGVDVLCNNAGVMAMDDKATLDGYDVQMQTNHLAHFLLTALLYPLLEVAAARVGEARVVNQSSLARKAGGLLLDAKYLNKNGGNLGGDPEGAPFQGPRWTRYQQSKLANVVFTYAMHDRLAGAGSKVKAVVAHPGVAISGLQGNSDGVDEQMAEIIKGRAQPVEDAALAILLCSCRLGVKSGQFFGPVDNEGRGGEPKLMPEEDLATPESRAMLWEESEKAVGQAFVIQTAKL